MSSEGNPGINKLANALTGRMKRENESPLILDFGEIRSDYSLITNTFPIPIPRSDYTVCRGITFGAAGTIMAETSEQLQEPPERHKHNMLLPSTMQSVRPGNRVLVAWVQNEAVVIDIILPAGRI